jgi:hypothetical protein
MSTADGHSSPFLMPDVTLWAFGFPLKLWSRFRDDRDDEQLTRWQLNL